MTGIKRVATAHSFSSAVVAGEYIFLGHHRGFGNTFPDQFDSTFAALQETLGKLGLALDHLVKVNVWLKNIQDLPEMEKLFYRHFAKDEFPARMTATMEFIDADCLLMVDGIAYVSSERMAGH